jgi:hypothetical protein
MGLSNAVVCGFWRKAHCSWPWLVWAWPAATNPNISSCYSAASSFLQLPLAARWPVRWPWGEILLHFRNRRLKHDLLTGAFMDCCVIRFTRRFFAAPSVGLSFGKVGPHWRFRSSWPYSSMPKHDVKKPGFGRNSQNMPIINSGSDVFCHGFINAEATFRLEIPCNFWGPYGSVIRTRVRRSCCGGILCRDHGRRLEFYKRCNSQSDIEP